MWRPEDPRICLIGGLSMGMLAILGLYFQFRKGWQQTVGLPLGYLSVLSISHIGALIYLLPWYDPLESAYLAAGKVSIDTVSIGTWLAGISSLCFAAGSSLIKTPLYGLSVERRHAIIALKQSTYKLRNVAQAGTISEQIWTTYLIPNKLIILGLLFLIFAPLLQRIPSFTPVATSAKFFVISGFCLGYLISVRKKSLVFQSYYAMAILILPAITVVLFGFLAAGANMLAVGVAFYVNRPVDKRSGLELNIWIKRIPVYAIALWLGLSLFVTYMNAREKIRRVVWEESALSEKLSASFNELLNFELFNIYDSKHLHILDSRLNQSDLIGQAILRHENNVIEFEMGQTLIYAAVAWVPRIMWPDKPFTGGSEFVAKHTGRQFADGTTVASGQVFELYANFGVLGPIVGFFLLGLLIRWIDRKASYSVTHDYIIQFVKWHIVGLVMIQPSVQIFFLVTAVAGAVVLTSLISSWLTRPLV